MQGSRAICRRTRHSQQATRTGGGQRQRPSRRCGMTQPRRRACGFLGTAASSKLHLVFQHQTVSTFTTFELRSQHMQHSDACLGRRMAHCPNCCRLLAAFRPRADEELAARRPCRSRSRCSSAAPCGRRPSNQRRRSINSRRRRPGRGSLPGCSSRPSSSRSRSSRGRRRLRPGSGTCSSR